MHQMKLWDNNLCPCCRQIPETSTMHIFCCPHPTMVHNKEKLFQSILLWLEVQQTDPSLLEMITSFWHGETPQLDDTSSPTLRSIYQLFCEIGVHQMWQGFLPQELVQTQDLYYQLIGSKKQENGGESIWSVKCSVPLIHYGWNATISCIYERPVASRASK